MKRPTICSAALLGALFMAPAWAHHPAQGIISDDLWNRINDHLIAVDSPHLSIDFEDMMGSMRLQDDPNYGCQLIVTSLTVPQAHVHDYSAHLELALEELNDEMGERAWNLSGGADRQPCNAPGYAVADLGDGMSEIMFFEPIRPMACQPDTDSGTDSGRGK